MRVDGGSFLVTGAASGLGAACGQALAAAGARVTLVDRDGDALHEQANAIGDAARAAVADVTDEEQVQAALALAVAEQGGLHGVVHCAGVVHVAKLLGRDGAHDLAAFERVVRVNLVGSFNVLRLAAAALVSDGAPEGEERGVIVTTASAAAYEGQIGQAAYSASKGGVVSLTLPAARELARHRIRVLSIAPGLFTTAIYEDVPSEAQRSLEAQVPFPSRFGRPREFADLVLAAIANPMLNGAAVRLDGALRMAPR